MGSQIQALLKMIQEYPVNNSMPSLQSYKRTRNLKEELEKLVLNKSENNFKLENKLDISNKTFERPKLKQMAKSFKESFSNWILSNNKITDEETLKTRLEACRKCEFWNSKALRGTGRCMKCGCSTWAKLRMATEKCPIGKW